MFKVIYVKLFYFCFLFFHYLIPFVNNIVAIYGKSYCEAAKDTWSLIKARGVEAIINDNLVGNVLVMGAVFIGALCALFGFGYIRLFLKNDIVDNNAILILVLICFFFGLVMTVIKIFFLFHFLFISYF
jgi:hypothetical protein